MARNSFWLAAALTLLTSGVFAQSPEVLGAARAELSALKLELDTLRAELTAQAESDVEAPIGAVTELPVAVIERLDALEAELRALTGQLERLAFQSNQRLSAAEARLQSLSDVLMEKDGQGPIVAATPEVDPFPKRLTTATQLTAQESADFDRIERLFKTPDYEGAIRRIDQFVLAYPGGPLTLEVMLTKAQAYEALEQWEAAADAYLALFNESGEDDIGSRALFGLGQSFEKLDRVEDACRSYRQIAELYPSSAVVVSADQAKRALTCPS